MAAAGWTTAPWPVVAGVACLPVVTLSFAAALFHRVRADMSTPADAPSVTPGRDSGDDKKDDKPPRKRPAPAPAGTKQARAADVIRDNPGMTNEELAALAGCKVRTIQRARNAGSKP
jgi:hypothetical protein